MGGWHHRLNGHGFGCILVVADGQGGLVAVVHGVAKSWTWLRDWTELNLTDITISSLIYVHKIEPLFLFRGGKIKKSASCLVHLPYCCFFIHLGLSILLQEIYSAVSIVISPRVKNNWLARRLLGFEN